MPVMMFSRVVFPLADGPIRKVEPPAYGQGHVPQGIFPVKLLGYVLELKHQRVSSYFSRNFWDSSSSSS